MRTLIGSPKPILLVESNAAFCDTKAQNDRKNRKKTMTGIQHLIMVPFSRITKEENPKSAQISCVTQKSVKPIIIWIIVIMYLAKIDSGMDGTIKPHSAAFRRLVSKNRTVSKEIFFKGGTFLTKDSIFFVHSDLVWYGNQKERGKINSTIITFFIHFNRI